MSKDRSIFSDAINYNIINTNFLLTFLQALCHSFPGNPTCLAYDAKYEHIAVGFHNGKISVYPFVLPSL